MGIELDMLPDRIARFQTGPVGPHIGSFAVAILGLGYRRRTCIQKTRLVAALSRWLTKRSVPLRLLDEQQADRFLQARWKRVRRQTGDQRTMTQLLDHLRQHQVISLPEPVLRNGIDELEYDYRSHLVQERALSASSVRFHVSLMRCFLEYRFPAKRVNLKKLSANDVTAFMLHNSLGLAHRSIRATACSLRSFLNFLYQRGRIATNLAGAVPKVAPSRHLEVPCFLEASQVQKLLNSCDRRRKVGKRDLAILLVFARLGLRASEAANLTLDDLNWRSGELLVRGKGARVDKLPLPKDVGQAIVAYLRSGRPDCASRKLFIQCQAPYVGFASPGIISVVQRAFKRAKVSSLRKGAHVLRHSLATRMLRSGASLAQIGQVLRHRQIQTTTIYAKVDTNALRALALPWPGGAL